MHDVVEVLFVDLQHDFVVGSGKLFQKNDFAVVDYFLQSQTDLTCFVNEIFV